MAKGLTLNLGLRFDKEDSAALRSDPLPVGQLRMGRQDRSAHRRRLRPAAQRQGQGLRQLRQVLRHHEDGPGARFVRQRLLAQLRLRHGRSRLHARSPRAYPIGGGCPATGPAPGVNVGRFIENVDFRATKADPRDPAISPNMKPMMQHEYVIGVDWAINTHLEASRPATRASAWTAPSKTWRSPTTWASTSATRARRLPTCCTVPSPSPVTRRRLHAGCGRQLPHQRALLRGVPAGRWAPSAAMTASNSALAKRAPAASGSATSSYTYSKLTRQLRRPDQLRSHRWRQADATLRTTAVRSTSRP